VIRKPEAIWEFPVEGGLVLARAEFPALHFLNRSAAVLWYLADDSSDTTELARRFAEHCGIPESVAIRDVETAVQQWSESLLRTHVPSVTVPDKAKPPTGIPTFAGTYCIDSKRFRLSFHGAELAAEFRPRFAPLRRSLETDAETVSIRVFSSGNHVYALRSQAPGHDETLVCESSVNAARAALLPELVRLARPGRQWIGIVHAGACALKGRALVLPGSSHSGKTTLMAALMQEGLEFLSDDSAAIERDTRLALPLPYALMIREGSWNVLTARYPQMADSPVLSRDAEQVRFLKPACVSQSGVPVYAFVFPKFVPGDECAIARIDSFTTLLRLQQSGFWTTHNPDSIRAFLDWAQSLPAYDLRYPSLDQAVAEIGRLFSESG
jgi:hypothetical protein